MKSEVSEVKWVGIGIKAARNERKLFLCRNEGGTANAATQPVPPLIQLTALEHIIQLRRAYLLGVRQPYRTDRRTHDMTPSGGVGRRADPVRSPHVRRTFSHNALTSFSVRVPPARRRSICSLVGPSRPGGSVCNSGPAITTHKDLGS